MCQQIIPGISGFLSRLAVSVEANGPLWTPAWTSDASDEKALIWRIVIAYATVASIAMISGFERAIRRDAVERERALQRERVELSQTIHDTTAQTGYMIGLGIDAATERAGDGNEELKATLAATSELSRSAMWDLRRPIGVGLPEGYEERGHGFRSMQADAKAMGGELIVESGRQEKRTTLTCVVPNRNTG